ncbi:MAG: ADP-forming succinate--CoA ligase subunit beta, partial [Acidobacteriota bacterium]|nr:ADP-forming succinate--CoA ligase subunit beta [Acidobacteriota bacterium]
YTQKTPRPGGGGGGGGGGAGGGGGVPGGGAAPAAAERLGGRVVVKAQIHAGGRGKGGGVKVVSGAAEAERTAEAMLGMTLVTVQTGPGGRRVGRLLIEEGLDIERELYVGLVIDRALARPVLMASRAGGMDIEQVAADTPESIRREALDPVAGLQPFQARRLAFGLGLERPVAGRAAAVMLAAARAFLDLDASLLEINPLVVTSGGDVLALDAKVSLDDNALFRHPELRELRDKAEEEALEVEASAHALSYVRLDGSIGCMVNGAGLAMATMDIIHLAGGEPANFLDVGGGANADQIRNAFRILMADPNVTAVLINIFGGILRCDVLAEGVIAAVRQLKVTLPVVIRMEGTNVEAGKRMLRESGLNFTTADTMSEAAERVVALAAG